MGVILRVQDFCFVHAIIIRWKSFFPRGHIYFSAGVLRNIILLLIISRGKFFFLLLPHPSLHFSTGPSLNQLLF